MSLYTNRTSVIPLTSAHARARRFRLLRRLFRRAPSVVRLTPDPAQAEALERKLAALSYTPECGFHRDRVQERIAR